MGLLHWCTVSPKGESSLAAIRFTAPIRISSVRIFPNGAQPFAQAPEVIARTEPEAFFIELLFNAHPTSQSDVKEKPRVANALVPTLIAYAGGQVDFTVDMGAEYATRLMIVKGSFSALSMAIYGDVVIDTPPVIKNYEPQSLPALEPTPLSRAIDPANSADPTEVAKQLLALIPDSPPLSLVVRLMFCLKPSNEDWDLPDFPYIYADLDTQTGDEEDLEAIFEIVSKPVRDNTTDEALEIFAARIANYPKHGDYVYHIARLLNISASQHSGMARALLHHLDIESTFNSQTLDEASLLHLLDAATNVDISRHLNNDTFLGTLRDLQGSFRTNKPTQLAARRLSSRIRDWSCFEDALSNTRGDFSRCWNMLKDIGTEEQSIGIWLESMILHEDIVIKLAENPVLPTPQSHSSLQFHNGASINSHDDFITFVRAFVGIASVLAVCAWSDSLGNDICREQALAILHLWQGVDGYREIVNHLLLLRQLTRRLEWIISDNDPPRKSGIMAEKVLSDLAKDPQAILHEDFVQTILSLKSPLSFIAEHELLSMRKVALVSEDGLPAAVEELMFSSDHPLSLRRLRTLRVSLAILERELDDPKGEWRALQAFWDEQSPGIVSCLVDLLIGVSDDLNGHFVLSQPPRMNHALADQLFRTVDDILRLVTQLAPAFPLTSRSMRRLTIAVADIFACTDMADMVYSQTTSACISAQGARQTCLTLVRNLCGPGTYAEPGRLGADVVLRTLLQHAAHSSNRDPAYHLLQVFTMIDHILPEPEMMYDVGESSHWVTFVLPSVLDEIKSFSRILDPENKAHFMKRLIRLDDDVIGIGAWLLTEELKHLTCTLECLASADATEDYRLVLQYQATLSLQFLQDLTAPTSPSSQWCLNSIVSTPDLSLALRSCLMALLDGSCTSLHLRRFISVLAQSANSFDPELKFTVLLAALHISQEEDTSSILGSIVHILKTTSEPINPESLRLEIGKTLSAFTHRLLDTTTSEDLLSIIEWLPLQTNTKFTSLCATTPDDFGTLCSSLLSSLPASKHTTLSSLRATLTIDEDTYLPLPSTDLPGHLVLPLHNIDDLFRSNIPTPSTPPRGTKTPDILGLIISPPTALLRAQATATATVTGLTKTYVNNDFRQLRQTPSARQNTSRLPSMHVDDFQQETSVPASLLASTTDLEVLAFQGLLNVDM